MSSPYNLRSSPRRPIKKQKHPDDSATNSENMTESDVSFDSKDGSYDEPDSSNVSQNSSSISKSGKPASSGSNKNSSAKKRTNTPQKRSPNLPERGQSSTPETVQRTPLSTNNAKPKFTKKDNNSMSYTTYFIMLFLLTAVVISALYMTFIAENNSQTLENGPKLLDTFLANMEHMKSRFPSQTRRFWKIVKVSLKRIILENNPEYPAVLLLVVPSGSKASKTGTCLAQHLTRTVNTLFNVTSAKVIDIPGGIRHTTPDQEKKDLDDQIKDSFQNGHFRSIAVDHFEQLSPRASLLFHGYCDGDNAPYKNVVIVFILHTQLNIENLQADHTLIDKHLVELWSASEYPLDRDKIDPLIARVANNAAVVKEENHLYCN